MTHNTASKKGSPLSLTVIREKKGLSIQNIADTTKISPRFLAAIEAQRFEELPGGIIGINYIRQYAECIGWDETELVAEFKESKTPKLDSRALAKPPQSSTSVAHKTMRWWLRYVGALSR